LVNHSSPNRANVLLLSTFAGDEDVGKAWLRRRASCDRTIGPKCDWVRQKQPGGRPRV